VSEAVTSVAGQSVNSLASGGITGITVRGFKSIVTKQLIEVRPLTILAGANSSGKTSFLQPLLLLKQTLEAPYDPGPLLLDGPNVKFTSGEQFLCRMAGGEPVDSFEIGIRIGTSRELGVTFRHEAIGAVFPHDVGAQFLRAKRGFRVHEMTVRYDAENIRLLPGVTVDKIDTLMPDSRWLSIAVQGTEFAVVRDRCFLTWVERPRGSEAAGAVSYTGAPQGFFVPHVRGLIHLPGLRGNPERVYPVTAVGPQFRESHKDVASFPGTFENYVASVIARWQSDGDEAPLRDLNRQMASMGLASRVAAMPISEAQVELQVPRLLRSERDQSDDLVNITDAGFGVSQTLPVLVALLAAKPGQAVYIEQPEIHLHPRAQVRLADVLAKAAKRGVRVIAETHSSLLLQAVQTLVAKGELAPNLVKLHWFVRSENDGSTEIRSADLDEEGAYGDWPLDFDDVELNSAKEYLDAAEARSRP